MKRSILLLIFWVYCVGLCFGGSLFSKSDFIDNDTIEIITRDNEGKITGKILVSYKEEINKKQAEVKNDL